jgi:hypothetical protein
VEQSHHQFFHRACYKGRGLVVISGFAGGGGTAWYLIGSVYVRFLYQRGSLSEFISDRFRTRSLWNQIGLESDRFGIR